MYYRLFEELELNVQNFSHSLKILVACLSYRYANIHIHSFVEFHICITLHKILYILANVITNAKYRLIEKFAKA